MNRYPDSYVAYLIEFHGTRDFFECHELLEEYWKEHPGDKLASVWVGFIQLAVAQYHERRGNRRGAEKLYPQAEWKLHSARLSELGINKEHLLEQLERRKLAVREAYTAAYEDINMEVTDEKLLAQCRQICAERGLEWGKPSSLDDVELIHRHTLRDRSDVRSSRLRALSEKEKERNEPI